MTFPTEQEIEYFCKPENREFFGRRWEPKPGNWVCDSHDGNRVAMLTHQIDGQWYGYWPYAKRVMFVAFVEDLTREVIPLFAVDQLIEMLEGQGRHWGLNGPFKMEDYRYQVTTQDVEGDRIDGRGLTPAIALAECLKQIAREVHNEEYQAQRKSFQKGR